MQTTTKAGHVNFQHDDAFKGEVIIVRGDQSMSVPIDALRLLVAEAVRYDLAVHVRSMKPEQLLRRIA